MARFLSAILTRDGGILTSPDTNDDHETLIAQAKLRENGMDYYVRVVFAPSTRRYQDIDSYVLGIMATERPGWLDEDRYNEAIKHLRCIVESMIASGKVPRDRRAS
ncbi:hypothetical protein LCGC14_3046870 [marine sediment metagenome]|uniref:Uncharacterized protein n=1 Tax=marine sediment metagenome TaxID=412755 RepID=A0A0F8WMU4_9ZZZZ